MIDLFIFVYAGCLMFAQIGVALFYLADILLRTTVNLVYAALHLFVYVNSTICMCELHCYFIQVFLQCIIFYFELMVGALHLYV